MWVLPLVAARLVLAAEEGRVEVRLHALEAYITEMSRDVVSQCLESIAIEVVGMETKIGTRRASRSRSRVVVGKHKRGR